MALLNLIDAARRVRRGSVDDRNMGSTFELMHMSPPHEGGDVTRLLVDWCRGDSAALGRLTPIIYADLIRLARAKPRRESRVCTLQHVRFTTSSAWWAR